MKKPEPRFRHRNALITGGKTATQSYVKTADCGSPVTWRVISGPFTSSRLAGRVDYIDDIKGDPPVKKEGVQGFRFHPMTKVTCEITGIGFCSWQTISKSQDCVATQAAYYQQWKSDRAPPYDQNLGWSGYSHKMIGDRLNLSLYPIPWEELSISKDLAATQALSKRGRQGESNLYESLAEIRKSLRTFNDVADRARKIHDAIFWRKGRSKSFIRTLSEESAGQLLMTNYGWKPLISDINSILVGLERTIEKRIVRCHGKHEVTRTTNRVLPDVNDSDVLLLRPSEQTKETWTARAVSVDQYTVSMLNYLGLSGKDLLLVPWELIRYSHVVDWFLNVGDLLGALVQDPSLLHIGQTTSIRYEREDTMSFALVGQHPNSAGSVNLVSASVCPSVSRTLTYYNREVGPLAPRLRLRPDSLNLTQTFNALAMLTVSTSKVKPLLFKRPQERKSIGRYVDELPRGAWRQHHWYG